MTHPDPPRAEGRSQRPAVRGPVTAERSHLRSVAWSLGAKAVTVPVTAAAALLTTRMVVDAVGVSGYALYALIITLPAVMPFGDLGIGAAIVQAVAQSRGGDPQILLRAVTSAARTLLVVGLLIACAGVVPACFGLWQSLLGHAAGPEADAAVAVALTLFGCSTFLSLGRTVLFALDRMHLTLLLQGAGSLLALLLVLLAVNVDAPVAVLVAPGFLTQCAVGAACLVWAGRLFHIPLWKVVAECVQPRQAGVRIRHLAAPMAVIGIGTALTYSTDRLVLSHVTDHVAVATYSAAAQLFTPAAGLLSAAAMPLWVFFARQRQSADEQPDRRALVRLMGYFAIGGITIALGLLLLGPTVASWMTHGRIPVGTTLMSAFAALLLVQAVYYPVGMWLTDAPGLRFQAITVTLMTAVNLVLSILLANLVGTPGPVIASVLSFTAVVLVPNARRALSHA